jgi:hypothetical protein
MTITRQDYALDMGDFLLGIVPWNWNFGPHPGNSGQSQAA